MRPAPPFAIVWAGLLVLAPVAPTLSAQSPADRAAIAALRDSMAAARGTADLEALRVAADAAVRADRRDPLARMRLGTILTRLGELNRSRGPLDDALRHHAAAADLQPGWPEPWYGLALSKLALQSGGYSPKEGPYQPLGSDYLHGAADGLIRALNADPTFVPAADALAPAVMRQGVQPMLKEALPPLRAAAQAAPNSDKVQLARGLIERENRQGDSALAAFRRYQELGGDPGVALIEQARTLYLLQRTAEAERAYYDGAAQADSPAAMALYRTDLSWVATRPELEELDRRTGAQRAAWLRDFWGRRDLREARAPGERLAEHYRRWYYVMDHFRLLAPTRDPNPGPTGNSPLVANRTPLADEHLRALARDNTGEDGGKSLAETGQASQTAVAFEDLELIDIYTQLNDQTLLRAFRSDQALVDDRGVVYMHYGEPDRRARYNGPQANPNESWKYLTPGGPLILHFMGSSAPTTLVEQLPLHPEVLATRGELDPRYDQMAAGLRQRRLLPEIQKADQQEGRRAIAVTTTSDAFPLRFDRPMAPIIQAFGLRRGLTGGGLVLVVFAVDAGALEPKRMGANQTIVYPLALRLAVEDTATGAITRVDTVRYLATPRVLNKGEWLQGRMEIAVPPGIHRVRAMVADGDMTVGAALEQDNVTVPDLAGDGLSMSDVVLGREESGQRWLAPPDTVSLNPLNAYPEGSVVEVYYQLGGLTPDRTYQTTIEVRRRGSDNPKDRVAVSFHDPARRARQSMNRSVALAGLKPGGYLVSVRIEDPATGRSVERSRFLNVVK